MVNRKYGPQFALFSLLIAVFPTSAPPCALAQATPPPPPLAAPPSAAPAPAPSNAPAAPPLPGPPSIIPPPIPGGATPMTMQQVVDIASAQNPTILAARQNFLSVKAQEIQAGVRQNPYFAATGGNLTEPDSSGNPYDATVGVGRLFERGQKRRWRLDTARATTVQTDDQLQLTIQQTILSVRTAFTNFLVAKAAKKLADDNLADYRREVALGYERYKAGDIAKLDYERLDLQLAQFESDESNAVTAAQQASDQLQVLLGYDKMRVDFDVTGEIVPPPLNFTMDELEQKGLANRPDFKAAQAGVAIADAQIKLAYANGTADPTLETDFDRNGVENSVGFSFNIPIRIFDRNQGNKQTAKFTAQANRFTLTAAHNQVISDIDQGYSGYINAKILSDRYNGHYLEEAKDVLEIARFSYEHGGLALIDYLDALRDARSVTSDALNAYQQTWIAIHQLAFVTATDLVP